MRKCFISLLAVLILTSACTPAKPEPAVRQPVVYKPLDRTMPASKRQACLDRGGVVEGRGMMGMETCVIRYKDAGKPCRNRKDCEGLCLAPAAGGDRLGPAQCQAENHRFGCFAEVDNGKADGPALCVD